MVVPRHFRLLSIAALLAATVALLSGPAASAHASLQSSDPPDKAVLAKAPARVLLVFSDETSATRSDGIVTDGNGATVSTGWKVDLNERARMTIALKPDLPGGAYTVKWKTLDESDNESETGTLTFTVQAASQVVTASATTPAATTSAPTAAPTVASATSTAAVTPTAASATAIRPPATQPAATGTGGATSAPPAAALPATGRASSESPSLWRQLFTPGIGVALLLVGLVLLLRRTRRV